MSEWVWIVYPALGAFLWGVGGTWWKPARRYVWPLSWLGLLLMGIVWWRLLLTIGLGVLTTSLGYGEGKSWAWRVLVAAAFGVVYWPLHFAWWVPVVTCCWFVGLMALSRRFNSVQWKSVEIAQGFLHGGLLAWSVR